MTLSDYERHLIGLLCWRCRRATHPSSGRQRQCPACRAKWSYHRRGTDWELLRAFGLSATAHHAARVVRCSYPTAHAAYTRFRHALQALNDAEKGPLLGELELDDGLPHYLLTVGQGCRDSKVAGATYPSDECRRTRL